MNSLVQFRNDTGLSQEQLADLLGVSRPLVSLAEKDQRSLPAQALIRFSQFRQVLRNSEVGEPVEGSPILIPKKEKTLLQKAQAVGLELDRIWLEVQNLEARMAVWKTALHLCGQLKSQEFVQVDARLLNAIDRFQEKTWIDWCEHGPRQLRQLLFYIDQKQAEKTFLENLASDFGKGLLTEVKK